MSHIQTIEQLFRSSHLSELLDDPSRMGIHKYSKHRMTLHGGDDRRQAQSPAPYRAKSMHDVERWQFWPRYLAMGNLIGNKFNQVSDLCPCGSALSDGQMLAMECETGLDLSKLDNAMQGPKMGKSYIAFDFRRQLLAIKGQFRRLNGELPPALRPLDAELSFEDIASQGIDIESQPSPAANGDNGKQFFDVTVTINTRRPPKFYCDFEGSDKLLAESRNKKIPVRRRATAIDFASTAVVSR